ncbi:hypothetical protein HanIR_Chr14g0673781 [Helianthus annuus]|nr:hypothetical protein HanIR_Chr14g0673781 [Helianthus annuus]
MFERLRTKKRRREFAHIVHAARQASNIQLLDIVGECIVQNSLDKLRATLSTKSEIDRKHFALIISTG